MPNKKKNTSRGKRDGGQGGNGGGNRRGKRGGGNMGNYDVVKPNRQSNRIAERVEFHLAKTSYCRNGYIETNSFNRPGEAILEGRCNDSASSKDREKFK